MHYKQKHIYVGIDLHKNTHTAVIINCFSEKLGEITFENKPKAFSKLIKKVEKHTKGLTPIYGLEDVGGHGRALAVYLLDNNNQVKEVNSALSYSLRISNPIVQKSDSWDAYCIATVLLNKLSTLPEANPHDLYWTIGQVVLRRTALVKALTNLLNQLHTQLSYSYPSYKQFFSKIDGKTALEFWEHYPAPHYLKRKTIKELKTFLLIASDNSLSTKKAETILALIEKDGDTYREYQTDRDFLVQSIVRDIKFKKQEIKKIEEKLEAMVKVLDYKLNTMSGIDTVTSASLVAEIGDINRFPNPNKLARFAGIAPVMFSSGGKGKYKKSSQGNRNLHSIIYFLAVRQIQVDKGTKRPRNPMFYEYYNRKLKEGKTKGQAIVCIMRRLINIIYGMMKNKTAYEMPELPQKKAG